MNNLMSKLMLSCQKATELIEKKIYFNLTNTELMQLFLHKSMCKACKSYEIQSKSIDLFLKSNSNINTIKISDELKNKIISNLK